MLVNILSGNFSLIDGILYIAASLVVILITMPIHEFAHGWMAVKLGDDTPRWQGRLTLNPFAHIDYLGALGILILGIGYAKPVQINPRNFRNPKQGMAITALAGPLSNIIAALISLLISSVASFFMYKAGLSVLSYVIIIFYFVALINVQLAVFNLIPVPPFDGSRILFAFLPNRYYFAVMRYERYIFIALFVLIYLGIFDAPLSFLTGKIMGGLEFLAQLPFNFL